MVLVPTRATRYPSIFSNSEANSSIGHPDVNSRAQRQASDQRPGIVPLRSQEFSPLVCLRFCGFSLA